MHSRSLVLLSYALMQDLTPLTCAYARPDPANVTPLTTGQRIPLLG
jgi:hypothetical protein